MAEKKRGMLGIVTGTVELLIATVVLYSALGTAFAFVLAQLVKPSLVS